MGLGGVAIAVPPYVIYPKTAVLGRAGGGKMEQAHLVKPAPLLPLLPSSLILLSHSAQRHKP